MRTPPCCCALAGVVAPCRSARRRAVVLWLAWRSPEAHAAVLLCSGWHGARRSARRRAVVLWLAWWRRSEARAAVLLCSGWRCGRSAKAAAPFFTFSAPPHTPPPAFRLNAPSPPRARPRHAQGQARPGKASQPPGSRPPGHRDRRVALCPQAPAPRSSPGGSKLEAGVIPLPCCPGASCAGRRAPAASSQGRRALGAKRRLGGARAAQLKLSG